MKYATMKYFQFLYYHLKWCCERWECNERIGSLPALVIQLWCITLWKFKIFSIFVDFWSPNKDTRQINRIHNFCSFLVHFPSTTSKIRSGFKKKVFDLAQNLTNNKNISLKNVNKYMANLIRGWIAWISDRGTIYKQLYDYFLFHQIHRS